MQDLPVSQFDGGLTDNYIGGLPNQYQKADNLSATQDKKLETRPGSTVDFPGSTRSRIAASATSRRIGLMIPFESTNFKQVVKTLQYDDGAALQELLGPASASAFSPVADQDTSFSFGTWNNHAFVSHDALNQRPLKFFKDTTFKLRTAGLPKPVNVAPTGCTALTTTDPYLVAFVYKYTYVVNSVTFIDRSSPRFFRKPNTNAFGAGALNSLILANAAGQHYDVGSASFVIEYYRTTSGGTVFYKVGETPNSNPTTGISDALADATLQQNETLYTTGGVAPNDRPPVAKIVHMTTDYGYYAHGKDVLSDSTDGELLKNRFWQSKKGDVDSVPSYFFVDLEGDIVGVSSVKSIPVVFCEGSIYRIDGVFDLFGRGGMIAQKISDSVGGVGQLNLIQTLEGIYFAGTDDFYFTDGYKVIPLGREFKTTYKTLVSSSLQKLHIYGAIDQVEKRVIWAVQRDTETADNNAFYVFDLFSQKMFTTWGSGYKSDDLTGTLTTQFQSNFQPTALSILNKDLYRADARGYTFKHTSGQYTDPKVDTAQSDTALWEVNPIIYDYRSCALDFNRADIRKWVTRFVLKLKNLTNISVQIKSDNDNRNSPQELKEFRVKSRILWGDPDVSWGDPVLWASQTRTVSGIRMFPKRSLRCEYKQIYITNSFSIITSSDNRGKGVIAGAGTNRTMTLSYGTLVGDTVNGNAAINDIVGGSGQVEVGMFVTGTGIAADTTVESLDALGNIFLSAPATATASGTTFSFFRKFPTTMVDYWISFESDDYTAIYKITDIGGTPDKTKITFTGADLLTNGSNKKWEVFGYAKGDIISILSYILYYMDITPSQTPFQGQVGANTETDS